MGYLQLKDGLLKSFFFQWPPLDQRLATRGHFLNIRLDVEKQNFEYTTFYLYRTHYHVSLSLVT